MDGKKQFNFAFFIKDSRILNRQPHSEGFAFRVVPPWLLSLIMVLILSAPAIYLDCHRCHAEGPIPTHRNHDLKPTAPLQDEDVENDPVQPKITKPDQVFDPIIVEAASRHNLDPALIKAIIMAESGFKPRAVSKCGARGLMQLMPRTATSLGVRDAFDPEHNIHGGTRYFKDLLSRFNGDIELGLAAYNTGTSKVKEHRGIPPYPGTRIFIKKVLKYYGVYKKEFNEEKETCKSVNNIDELVKNKKTSFSNLIYNF